MNYKNIIPMYLRYRLMEFRNRGIYAGYPDDCQCIYIHIPKTAGSSVVKSLFNETSRHVHYIEYKNANEKKFSKYYKFTFVRNPWARLVSTYFFLKKGGMNSLDKDWSDKYLSQFESFDQFVTNWITKESIWRWVHFYPQYYFICDDNDNNMMDFVGRMENIDEDFNHICLRLGKSCELSKVNISDNKHYSEYYTEKTKRIVDEVYKKDIELFDYTF